MIVTQADAKRIIAAAYGPEFAYRLTGKVMIGVRPAHETSLGFPTLAWIKVAPGRHSVVRIGQLLPIGGFNWGWTP